MWIFRSVRGRSFHYTYCIPYFTGSSLTSPRRPQAIHSDFCFQCRSMLFPRHYSFAGERCGLDIRYLIKLSSTSCMFCIKYYHWQLICRVVIPSGYYVRSIYTIQALSDSYLISHIDTFHTPYRVFRDQFPRLAVVYTKHLSIIQPTEKPSKEPDKNVSGIRSFFFSPRRWIHSTPNYLGNALRHHTPAEPWNHPKFRVHRTCGRNQNSTFNNGYPRAVPGYINHGTIGKDRISTLFLSCSLSSVYCNMVLMYVVHMYKLTVSSAPPCLTVSAPLSVSM